ncbi:MAG: hypothetical protein VKJ46_02485 [Leptolyngbyaceae bacterium]|nr:hypothetical protein [Leptolyngbyaceae bacterium]
MIIRMADLRDFIINYPSIGGSAFGAFAGFLATAFWTFRNERNQKQAVRKMLKLEIDSNIVQIKAIVIAFEAKLNLLIQEAKRGEVHTNIFSPGLFNNMYIRKTAYERLMVEMSRALSEKEFEEFLNFMEL